MSDTASVLRLGLVACALVAMAAASTAFAKPRTVTTDDDYTRIWAKVANQRAQSNAQKSGSAFEREESRCGNVEIGNVDTGGGGGARRAPREVVTIVTGDIVNAPTRCR